MKKKIIDFFSAAAFLPLSFVYFEALLRIFSGGGFSGYAYPLVFGISAGLFLAALLSLLPPKANKASTTVILFGAGLVFAAEALVNKNFQTYMPLSSILGGAKGVVTEYGENFAAAVVGGIPQILLFLSPGIFYLIFRNKLPISPKERSGFPTPVISMLCSTGLFFGGVTVSGDDYGEENDFNISAESLGLFTALRLNIQGDRAGDDDIGFVPETPQPLSLGKSASEGADFVAPREALAAASDNVKPSQNVTLGKSQNPEISDKPENPGKSGSDLSESELSDISAEETATPKETEAPHITIGSSGENISRETGNDIADSNADNANADKPKKPAKPAVSDPEAYGYNIMEPDFDGAYARKPNSAISELNGYVQSLSPTNKNGYTGLFAGKNLILICAEAFSDCAIDEQLTPTLYRMTHKGIYFSEYYQPTWGGSTTTGEFSFVTGLVPESGLTSMQKSANNNNYLTMGSQLQRQGYRSCAFHNGNYDYYSRNLTHKNLGYDDFLAFGNGLENITRKYSEDSAMIDKTVDLYLDKQPFSLYYMTVSGHFSYKADNVKVKENLPRVKEVFGNRYKDKTNYYLCYQMELDKAMEILIEKLEAAGIADNTVICLTADHYPYGLEQSSAYGNSEDYIADLYGGSHSAPWERDRNAWILWSGCLENEYSAYACEVTEPAYSLDIVPTLSNLFGVEYDSRLLVGRDVFSNAPPLALWSNYSWVTDKGRYNAKTKEFFPADGSEYSSEYVKNINNIVKNKISFSRRTVNEDYYGALFD